MTDTQDLIAQLYASDAASALTNQAARALEAAKAEIERQIHIIKSPWMERDVMRVERDAAFARLAELKKQEPIRYWVNGAGTYDNESVAKDWAAAFKSEVVPLYAAAGASPVQPSQADAQDAARYRWLRLNTNYEDRGTFRAPNGDLVSPMSRRWYHQTTDLASDTLDAAIDAAINAKESGK